MKEDNLKYLDRYRDDQQEVQVLNNEIQALTQEFERIKFQLEKKIHARNETKRRSEEYLERIATNQSAVPGLRIR